MTFRRSMSLAVVLGNSPKAEGLSQIDNRLSAEGLRGR
jgi:hypothetical protein